MTREERSMFRILAQRWHNEGRQLADLAASGPAALEDERLGKSEAKMACAAELLMILEGQR